MTSRICLLVVVMLCGNRLALADDGSAKPDTTLQQSYDNRLKRLAIPQPICADYPEFFQPIVDIVRFEAAPLVDQPDADLSVRSWRWSYNARGIIEMPNRLIGSQTALVVVHPWGIDDGQGWISPEPAGCAFQCTPEKNALLARHVKMVVNPLLKRLRPHVGMVLYSLPGKEDPVRKKLYRSVRSRPTAADRAAGTMELAAALKNFKYAGESLPEKLQLSKELPVSDYFRQFPGLDATARFNHEGFWQLPTPVHRQIEVLDDDVVIYDAEGYPLLRDFLRQNGIRHILLAGYNTDMCVCATTAGYKNLQPDFNVMLVADATVATFPANSKPAYATNAAVSFAALNLLITQCSWIEPIK
jgi:nicotinamidase-related amidase